MEKQIGFFIFGFRGIETGNSVPLDVRKCWVSTRKFWRSIVLGIGFFSNAALIVSCGQAASNTIPAPPATNVSTSTGTSVSTPSITNEPAYTVAQLTNLISANVDTNLFVQQLKRWGVNWDVATILKLHGNGVSDADLQYIEQAFKLANSNSPAPAVSTNSLPTVSTVQASGSPSNATAANVSETGSDTNLDIHVVQVAVLFKNNFSISNIAGYFSQCGLKLDAVTIFNLDKAGVTLTNIQTLEQFVASQPTAQAVSVGSQTASLKLAGVTNLDLAAINNLSVAATNVPMARTNLPVVAEYAQCMVTNLSILPTNSDVQGFSLLTNNLEDIAAGINEYAANLPTNNPPTNSNWRASFSSGAEFLNPYVISVPDGAKYGTLTNAGSSTVAYLQFDLTRRWVFAPYSYSSNRWINRFPIISPFTKDRSWDDLTPDFQYDMGFLLGNSVNSTNKTYSAQSLAGADIYAQLGAGLPVWRNDLANDCGIPVQVTLSGSVGLTTSQSFEKVYVNEFIGGTLDVGLNGLFGIGNTNASGLAEFKIGEAHLDFPSMTGTNNQVNLDGNGVPEFNEKWVPEIGTYVLIPFGNYLYLNIEANTFLQDQTPDQWNVKVGVTVPWSTVQGMFPFIK